MDRTKEQFRRAVRAIVGEFEVLRGSGGQWYVTNGESRETYETSEAGCTCGDWEHRCREEGLKCKHQMALALYLSHMAAAAARFDRIFG